MTVRETARQNRSAIDASVQMLRYIENHQHRLSAAYMNETINLTALMASEPMKRSELLQSRYDELMAVEVHDDGDLHDLMSRIQAVMNVASIAQVQLKAVDA